MILDGTAASRRYRHLRGGFANGNKSPDASIGFNRNDHNRLYSTRGVIQITKGRKIFSKYCGMTGVKWFQVNFV